MLEDQMFLTLTGLSLKSWVNSSTALCVEKQTQHDHVAVNELKHQTHVANMNTQQNTWAEANGEQVCRLSGDLLEQ